MTRRPPLAVRHAATHRVAFTATALAVIVTTVLAATAAAFAGEVSGAAVRRTLATNPGRAILAAAPVTTAAAAAAAGGRARATIEDALAGLPVAFTASLQSQDLNLPPGSAGGPHAQVTIVSLPGLAARAALTAGSWPAAGAPRPSAPVPVAVPAVVARLLRLAPGEVFTTRDSVSGAPVPVRVTGIYRPRGPASPYWTLDPVGASGVARSGGFSVYGPLATSPADAAAPGFPLVSADWLAVPDVARLGPANLGALGARLLPMLGGPGGAAGLAHVPQSSVTTALPALLTRLSTALVIARSQLLIGVLILLAIAAAAVAVSVRLLAGQREGEVALLAARGASRQQLGTRGTGEALSLAVPAVIAGPLLGVRLASLLARTGALARAGLRPGTQIPVTVWLTATAVALGCAVIVALPWLRTPPSPVRHRVTSGRQRAVATVVAGGADVALIALAAIAGWQLAHYQAPVSTGLDGALGIDPVLVISPVLMLVAGTVAVLRLLPLVTRLADRAAARGRGLVLAVASWQLSRRPLRQAGPALLAVLAVAAAVLTLAQHTSWQRSVGDQAAFAVGADERVTLPPSAPLPMGAVADVTAAPGVRAATPAITTSVTLPEGKTATLLALDPRAAAGIVPLRSDLATRPPAALLRGLAPAAPPSGAPVPGRPARLSLTAELGRGTSGPAALALELTDAAGLSYQVPVGNVPADGRRHQLTVVIAPHHRADYPLRVTGFTLQYTMPAAASRPESFTVGPARASAGLAGPFGAAFPLSARGARLITGLGAESGGVIQPPRAAGTSVTPGGALTVRFTTGNGENTGYDFRTPVQVGLSVMANPGFATLPALATNAFMTANAQRVGATVPVQFDGATVPVKLTGVMSGFPTLGAASGLVVDQAALQAVLRAAGNPPLPATQWWLRISRPPRLTGLPPGTDIAARASVAASLRAEPLSAGPQQALLAIAVAAALLAVAGFVVSVATARERAHDVALLDALGAPPRAVTGLLCLEQAMLAAFAAVAGLALGALLSRLIIPAVSLTAQAAQPQPPVLVEIPWGPAVAIAVVIAAVPTAAAGLAARRRIATSARLRVEEQG